MNYLNNIGKLAGNLNNTISNTLGGGGNPSNKDTKDNTK